MFPILHAESSLGHESYGPFSITRMLPPWRGVWVAATIYTLGMRSLKWRRCCCMQTPLATMSPPTFKKGCMLRKHYFLWDLMMP